MEEFHPRRGAAGSAILRMVVLSCKVAPMSAFLSAISALLYGTGDFLGGFASRRERLLPVMILSQAAGLLVAIAFLPVFGFAFPGSRVLAMGALSGLAGALGLALLYRGLGHSLVAIVSPTSALVAALLPLAFGAATGERPSVLSLAGAAACLPAILLLSLGGEKRGPGGANARIRALLIGAGAGFGFGLFFILLAGSGDSGGIWPLIAARFSSIGIFLGIAAMRRENLRIGKNSLAFTLAAGVLDMGANIAFLAASRLGLLMLASAVTSLYPAPTVILARVFMGQKLGPARAAGLALAIAGCALIAIG
jgi:drug/metabolite transporter (DMT)-like permease